MLHPYFSVLASCLPPKSITSKINDRGPISETPAICRWLLEICRTSDNMIHLQPTESDDQEPEYGIQPVSVVCESWKQPARWFL